MTIERRQFTRIRFNANGRFSFADGEFEVEVVDISLKGALVRPQGNLFAAIGTEGILEIGLDGADTAIRMETTIVHSKDGCFGLASREIDLDSITHLRRLVELNVGDEAILNRELTALVHMEAN